MQKRDVTIPIALWICAAVCAHLLGGAGGLVAADVHDDRSELWKLSHRASSLAKEDGRTFEVSLNEPGEEPSEQAPPPPKAAEAPKPALTEKPPEPVAPKPEAKKDEKRVVVLEKARSKPLVLPEDVLKDRRVAVRQHAKPDQEDNPTAKLVADEANHVDHETRATLTSHDRDEERPTPAGNHAGTDREPGDSEKTRIAESGEHAGERNRAPGERGTDFDVLHEPKIPRPASQPVAAAAPLEPGHRAPNDATASHETPPLPSPGEATPPSPDVETVPGGTWTFNPARTGGATGSVVRPKAGEARDLAGGKLWSLPGLGQAGASGALNTNLTQTQVASIVGTDALRQLREADGERRKSEHRGSWAGSNFEKWRSAIENYVSTVKPGNQTALNTAAVPFASYLNGMHNRIHPIFAESFLESLDDLPAAHPLNDQHLVTRLEIVLTPSGHLKKMGIVRTSGITAFDIAALDAVDRAQPFGPAPGAIVSPDGNVYLHWEFHRDEVYACSTMGARPFILGAPPPGSVEPTLPPSSPQPRNPARERGVPPSSPNDAREGALPWKSHPAGLALRGT